MLLFPEEVELEEGVYMRLFALHLEGKACVWFMKLPKSKISSLLEMIELFCRRWCPRKHHRWIPYVEYAGTLFSKEIHNGNQIDEANYLSSIVDEAPYVDEYGCDPTHGDPEALVEEDEEKKERVSSPSQHNNFL